MKKKGSVCDYTRQRNENLRREFFSRLGRNGHSLEVLFDELASVPADRFYINEERVYKLLRAESNGKPMPPSTTRPVLRSRLVMIAEIRRRVYRLMSARPGLPLRDAVYEVVNSPAPSFYLKRDSLKTLLYRYLRSDKSMRS